MAQRYRRSTILRRVPTRVFLPVTGLRTNAKKSCGASFPRWIQKQDANEAAGYLHRNRARMRYDEYLAKGWPIASGPVEGACQNLIKDRMERSGMRWTEEMAAAVVKLRAIYLSGDFDRYWSFHIAKDKQRLHPGHWSVVLK